MAADDLGEVGFALLFAGRDGVGVEASFGVGVDPGGLAAQGGDLAVGAADVRACWSLAADEAEVAALRAVAAGCPEQTVTYEPAV